MARALELAARGCCSTHPNPRVGAVLVREGVVVGEGWHQRAGEAHAEVHALAAAGSAARGATLYVNLEPCSHHGRTPPCADAVIAAGIARVVVAGEDPNPLVAGRGLAALGAAGIEVRLGVLETVAEELNRGFHSRMRRGRPWVCLKLAQSLDGRTALANGASQWISGPEARADVQRLRAESDAILTGIGSVLADDPRLTVRDSPWVERIAKQPLRVVVDSTGRLPPSARIASDGGRTLQVTAVDLRAPERDGVLRMLCPGTADRVDLASLLTALAGRGINQLLVEAGPVLAGALLTVGLVDELVIYQATRLLGHTARPLLELPTRERLLDCPEWQLLELRQIGSDLRLRLRPPA
jgi:diaminohydroxyphosphoribosylaminopyrimidine deaminase / 5-amino-6-(5-phosphoribosylamino)uracil reductase